MYVCMHACADDCICMEVRYQLKELVLSSVWVLGLNSGCQKSNLIRLNHCFLTVHINGLCYNTVMHR